ncbi:MAG: hypothetical protein QOH26_735 [Actinomycetota bacterium]|nr:hypothetical protein [Actinomycetota bacterium]
MSRLKDGLIAGAVASIVGGIPSTLYSLVTGADVLEPTRAAGSMIVSDDAPNEVLLAAAVPVHLALSLGWGVALSLILPRKRPLLYGATAGAAIAALDLGVVGPRFPRIRALPQGAQIADHICFGAVVAIVLSRRRSAA